MLGNIGDQCNPMNGGGKGFLVRCGNLFNGLCQVPTPSWILREMVEFWKDGFPPPRSQKTGVFAALQGKPENHVGLRMFLTPPERFSTPTVSSAVFTAPGPSARRTHLRSRRKEGRDVVIVGKNFPL